MVDAAAAAPDTANTQPAPQAAAPRPSTAVDQAAAKVSAHRNNGATGTTQSMPPDTKAPADATKNVTATTTPVASSNTTVNPSATQDAAANQAATDAATDTGAALNVLAGQATTSVNDATANADVTILNAGSADYHGRQLVRVIRNECWRD